MKNKKGFTLVELIVVLVILAILIALLVPALTGYIDKAQEKSALAECKQVVTATQTTASEKYADGTFSTKAIMDMMDETILPLAEVSGNVIDVEFTTENAKIASLIYQASNKKYVRYDGKTYTLSNDDPSRTSASGHLKVASSLLEKAEALPGNVWNDLRDLFQEEYNGKNPALSDAEKKLFSSSISDSTVSDLSWKPTIASDGSVAMIASSQSNSKQTNLAYLVYYNGKYYTHDNGHGKQDSAFVAADLKFDVSTLTTDSQWKEVSPSN